MDGLGKLISGFRRRKLDAVVVCGEANLQAMIGVKCDNGTLLLDGTKDGRGLVFYTDFRYIPMAHRVAPELTVEDIGRFAFPAGAKRIGFESSLSYARYERFRKSAPRNARFVTVDDELDAFRAVKSADGIARLRAAQALNLAIWRDASAAFRAGMTELGMARIIRRMMLERGEGEAFETIVCVGKNAAECHHVPDDTVWNGREPVLVDMGVRFGGVCSDLTRNILPKRRSRAYAEVHELVRRAHDAAIAAVKPGMVARDLDAVARRIIAKGGFGKCFGHSLGHGVGYEIHEAPTVSRRGEMVLKPGMVFTIEPGIYLEGNLGVRIEDMVLVTPTGCEVLA